MPDLTDAQRRQLIDLLQCGADIPHAYKDLLFPPKDQEYELVYAGKEPEAQILATQPLGLLRQIRLFGADQAAWHNRLIFGNNREALQHLLLMNARGDLVNAGGSQGVKLVYIDPPFATRQEFQGSQEERAYQDKVAGAQFVEFLRKRLVLLMALLADDGFLCIHLDFRKKHYIKVILDELFGEQHFRNEIAVNRIKKNIRERERVRKLNEEFDTILVYAKSDAALLVPPTRRVAREERWHAFDAAGVRTGMDYDLFGHTPPPGRHWMYSKERAEQMIAAGTLRPNPRTRRPQYLIAASDQDLCNNLWTDISAYTFTVGYPTEKSEALLSRVLEMASQPGDLVLDAFAGSGTTLAVAEKLGRRWIGIDCGKLAIYTIQKRMLQLRSGIGNKGKLLKVKPFALYTAGSSYFTQAMQVGWEVWRQHVFGLFQCAITPHTIGDVQFDGYRGAAPVLLFNHACSGGRLDYQYIDALHARLNATIDGPCWIVAPAASVTLLEDCVTKDRTRYMLLRVPSSIVDVFHAHRDATSTQATSRPPDTSIDAAVGFDLIRPPQVACVYSIRRRADDLLKDDAVISIKTFKSVAPMKAVNRKQNLETLSLVLVDYDYPYAPTRSDIQAAPFKLDAVFTAEQIAAAGWEVQMPCESLGAAIMVIYVDIYGNEYTEIKALTDFIQPYTLNVVEHDVM